MSEALKFNNRQMDAFRFMYPDGIPPHLLKEPKPHYFERACFILEEFERKCEDIGKPLKESEDRARASLEEYTNEQQD